MDSSYKRHKWSRSLSFLRYEEVIFEFVDASEGYSLAAWYEATVSGFVNLCILSEEMNITIVPLRPGQSRRSSFETGKTDSGTENIIYIYTGLTVKFRHTEPIPQVAITVESQYFSPEDIWLPCIVFHSPAISALDHSEVTVLDRRLSLGVGVV